MVQARWFLRLTAVLVGLVNLAALAVYLGGNPSPPTNADWSATIRLASPYVLAAIAAGLVTAEVSIGRFDRLSAFGRYVFFDRPSYLHAGVVGATCLGGALMGGLYGALLFFPSFLDGMAMLTLPEQTAAVLLRALIQGSVGALHGAVAGALEGLLLAPPLAAVLRRSGVDRPSPGATA